MALVEDKNDPLVLQRVHLLEIGCFADRRVELLQGCHDELGVRVSELAHQLLGVVSAINTAFAEAVELLDRLVIQILAIDTENHFMHVC